MLLDVRLEDLPVGAHAPLVALLLDGLVVQLAHAPQQLKSNSPLHRTNVTSGDLPRQISLATHLNRSQAL